MISWCGSSIQVSRGRGGGQVDFFYWGVMFIHVININVYNHKYQTIIYVSHAGGVTFIFVFSALFYGIFYC